MKGTNNASREKVYEPAKKIRGERLRRTTGDRWGIFMLVLTLALLLFVMAASVFEAAEWLGEHVRLRSAEGSLPEDAPAEGIARIPAVARYLDVAEDEAEYHTIEEYREGDAPVPEWWNPEEQMAAEWEDVTDIYVGDNNVLIKSDDSASYEQVTETNNEADYVDLGTDSDAEVKVTDLGCPDWNVDTTVWGWDGHGMEAWEFDLFVRIVYLEFWGTSRACVEAGIDSMLLLWDIGEYGRTMGELLSAQYAPGYYVYSPYAYIWEWEYDSDGLAEIRAMCEERFMSGPEWCAPYFRLWYYHEWAVPAYEIDGVYFSVPKGWKR